MDYVNVVELLKKRNTKKLKGNTYLVKEEDHVGLKFHDTIIAKFYPNYQEIQVDGFHTRTTKSRLNEFCTGVYINQSQHIWYINKLQFVDGIRVDYRGQVLNPEICPADRKAQDRMLKKIDKYIKGFDGHIKAGKLTIPSSGDCWHCRGVLSDTNHSHILYHFEESYYVPTLLSNAIKEYGYTDLALIFMMIRDNNLHVAKPILRAYLTKRLIK